MNVPARLLSGLLVLLAWGAAHTASVTQDQGDLLVATLVGDAAKVKTLLARGVSPNFADPLKRGLTPLAAALGKGDRVVVEALLEAKADVNLPDGQGMTPLMHAVRADAGLTDLLLRAGADPKRHDPGGMSALHWAIAGGKGVGTLPLLLRVGADPNDRHKDGTTPLMLAARNGRPELIPLLVEAGADLEAVEPKRGMTALGIAVATDQEATTAALLAAGADPNQRMQDGVTALIAAAMAGNTKIAALLIKNGADVNQKADNNVGPLAAAHGKGDAAMIGLLQAAGAQESPRPTAP